MELNCKSKAIWLLIAASLLTFLTTTGFVWNQVQPPTVLKISPQTLKMRVGQKTTVDLAIEKVSELYGAEIHLRFDPGVLEVVDADPTQEGVQIEPGTFPSPDFVVQNVVDNRTGTIDYASTQLPPNKPGKGDGIVARITFQAKRAAVSSIQLSEFLLADTQGGSIEAVPQHGQVRVSASSTWVFVAAAALLVLLIAGAGIGFVLLRRK